MATDRLTSDQKRDRTYTREKTQRQAEDDVKRYGDKPFRMSGLEFGGALVTYDIPVPDIRVPVLEVYLPSKAVLEVRNNGAFKKILAKAAAGLVDNKGIRRQQVHG